MNRADVSTFERKILTYKLIPQGGGSVKAGSFEHLTPHVRDSYEPSQGLAVTPRQAWAEVPVSELWHWCALASFLDPSTIPVETALTRWVHEMTAGRLFQDRVVMLSKVIECSWGPDPVSRAVDVKRSLVRVDDFRDWALRADLPLPEHFPRPAGGTEPKGRRAAAVDGAFIRQAEMIPGLLPFSPATLWRKVKTGEFPRRKRAWKSG